MIISRLFNTIRHLKPIQLTERYRRRIRKLKTKQLPLERRHVFGTWQPVELAHSSIKKKNQFTFLNRSGVLNRTSDWNQSGQEKLWLYNLHYFDDLNALDNSVRNAIHQELVNRWITENPALRGNGWEPYPISLRIVNWIKWFLNGQEPDQQWLDSLCQQAHVLSQSLEYHLLGNHLFANAKALVFAGLYFKGSQAEKWLTTGLTILDREVPEQILDDGGNFERTPMYHNLMLCDLLDLINIGRNYEYPLITEKLKQWEKTVSGMLGWMEEMIHPDGEMSFFNDSAMGVALTPQKLRDYAARLGISHKTWSKKYSNADFKFNHFFDSGYIRAESVNSVAILDCAKIGPDYIPGHAHADTLSFELSLFGQRVLVNSGTGCYGESDERLRQRQTAAHNTVEVDEKSSSEVWSGFRVARRAYPSKPEIKADSGIISCSHDGYKRLKGRVIHTRTWQFERNSLLVMDELKGSYNLAKSHWHLHPRISTSMKGDQVVLSLSSGKQVRLEVEGGKVLIVNSTWHPEFGLTIPNHKIVIEFLKPKVLVSINWNN